MTMSLEFSIHAGSGLYSCRYEKGVLNAADFSKGIAQIKEVEPTDAEVRSILAYAVSGNEAELVALIELMAMNGEPIGQRREEN